MYNESSRGCDLAQNKPKTLLRFIALRLTVKFGSTQLGVQSNFKSYSDATAATNIAIFNINL